MAGHRADSLAALVQEASKIPSAERGAWLRTKCAGDAALAARVHDALPTDAGDAATPSPLVRPIEDVPESARRIGPYLIRGILGEGTFGVVYLAEQSEPLPRRVALKVLKSARGCREVVERFDRERRLLARLDHPAIAHVLDAGVDRDRSWFALEYVRGLPLLRHADDARLTVRDRLRLFEEICRGVQHAHQNGVLHRDLKPGNVLVSTGAPGDGTPRWGIPKIIDFGIAEAIGGDGAAPASADAGGSDAGSSGRLIGTLEYMSPEQAIGLDVDARSDVHSLGAILFELLTGEPPFGRADRSSEGIVAFVKRLREEDARAPSTALVARPPDRAEEIARLRRTTPARLAAHVRGDLDWIVLKCLSKDRARRYDSAADLASDVRRHLEWRPVEAAPQRVLYRAGRFVRRHRGAAVAAAISITSLLLALALVAAALVTTMRAREHERQARQGMERAIAVASDALGSLISLIASISLDRASKGIATTPDAILKSAMDQIIEPFKDRPIAQAHVRIALAKALLSLDHPNAAESQITTALALLAPAATGAHASESGDVASEALRAAADSSTIDAMRTAAAIAEHVGDFARARSFLSQAFDLQEKSDPDDPPAWNELWIDRARLAISAGDARSAQIAIANARQLIPHLSDRAAQRRAESSAAFFAAEALALANDWSAAYAAIQPNLRYNLAHLPGHWWVAESSAIEAAALIGLGRVDEGRAILAKAEPQLRQALPPGASPRRVIGKIVGDAFQSRGLSKDADHWRALAAP